MSHSSHLRCCALAIVACVIAASARTDERTSPQPRSEPRAIVPETIAKKWNITLAVGCGGGMEAFRFGWHKFELDSDGNATLVHHGDLAFNTSKADSPNATVKFRGKITPEQRAAVLRAAAATVNRFELQPTGGTRSEDGCRVALTIATERRDVSISARELGRLRDAGDDLVRLIQVINAFLPAGAALKSE